MFGVDLQAVVVIVFLLPVVFGPGKAVSLARDLGRFANDARGQVEEFKAEILGGEEDRDEPASDALTDDEGEPREQEEATHP